MATMGGGTGEVLRAETEAFGVRISNVTRLTLALTISSILARSATSGLFKALEVNYASRQWLPLIISLDF